MPRNGPSAKDTLAQLEAAERRLRDITDAMPGALYQFRVGADGAVQMTYLSEGIQRLVGVDPHEGQEDKTAQYRTVLPEDMLRVASAIREATQKLEQLSVDFRIRHAKSGELRWIRSMGQPQRQPDGSTVFNGFWQDITKEHEAEERLHAAQKRLVSITDSVPGVVFESHWSEKTGDALPFISGGVDELCGVTKEEAEASIRNLFSVVVPEDLQRFMGMMQEGHTHENPVLMDFRIRHRKTGQMRWARIAASAPRHTPDGFRWRSGFWQDITDIKQLQDQLAEARDAAEAANKAKSEFLARMSHEIRTPMNAIIGLSQLALRGTLPPRERDYLERTQRAAKSLLGVINDILDFSKVEAGKLALEAIPFRLDEVLDNLDAVIGVKAAEKRLSYSCRVAAEVPGVLVGDPLRLGQVLVNLAGNAVKFTERGGVRVRVGCLERSTGEAVLQFEVQDSGIGIGIEAGQRQRLFEGFFQADASTSRRYGGTGLGLAISWRLVEAMGGRIEVDSEPGKGSSFRFSVRLGLASELQLSELPAPAQASGLQGMRLLVVDDNDTNQLIAREMLEAVGAQVRCAANGRQALSALEAEGFDAVLMDVHMPEMDGYEATRRLRANPRHALLPIIAMTASVTLQDRALCEAAGMNAHVGKPIDLDELLVTLLRWARPQRSEPVALPAVVPEDWGLPGIDVAAGMRRVGGRRETYLRVLKVFADSSGDPPAELRIALAVGATDTALEVAHRLRGAAANIGATDLAAAAGDLEKALREERDPALPIARIQACWEQLRPGLDELLG